MIYGLAFKNKLGEREISCSAYFFLQLSPNPLTTKTETNK